MEHNTQKQQKEILITNITTKDDGFAVIPETGEGVYIPPGVTKAASLVSGEMRFATLIENKPDHQKNTMFMGIYIQPVGDTAAETFEDEGIEKGILDILEDAESYLTTGEIAYEVGQKNDLVWEKLNKLFTAGSVARADIYHHSNRSSINVLWANSPDKFL